MKRIQTQKNKRTFVLNARLSSLENKTNKALVMITDLHRILSEKSKNEHVFLDAIDNLDEATQNLIEARNRVNNN